MANILPGAKGTGSQMFTEIILHSAMDLHINKSIITNICSEGLSLFCPSSIEFFLRAWSPIRYN